MSFNQPFDLLLFYMAGSFAAHAAIHFLCLFVAPGLWSWCLTKDGKS